MNLPTSDSPFNRSRRNWLLPLVVTLLSGWISTVQAGHYLQAYADARADPLTDTVDTGQIAGPIAMAGPLDILQDDTEARVFAQAVYGHLSGNAFATNPSLLIRAVQAGGTASFMDTLMITSSVLAPGTSVTVLAHVTLEDDLFFQSGLVLTGGYELSALVFQDEGNLIEVVSHTRSQMTTLTLNESVGTPFSIGGTLGFSASARTVDAPNTGDVKMADARFTFEVLAPDTTLVSESGTSYAPNGPLPSVPEPSSLVLFGLGALSFLAIAARRRKFRFAD